MNLAVLNKASKEFSEYSLRVKNEYGGNQAGYYIDMVWCLLKYGARPIDYWRFEFQKKRSCERKRYLTLFKYFKLAKKLRKQSNSKRGGYLIAFLEIKKRNTNYFPILSTASGYLLQKIRILTRLKNLLKIIKKLLPNQMEANKAKEFLLLTATQRIPKKIFLNY